MEECSTVANLFVLINVQVLNVSSGARFRSINSDLLHLTLIEPQSCSSGHRQSVEELIRFVLYVRVGSTHSSLRFFFRSAAVLLNSRRMAFSHSFGTPKSNCMVFIKLTLSSKHNSRSTSSLGGKISPELAHIGSDQLKISPRG